MAVWWSAWPFTLCLICAWLAMGIMLGLGAFWVLAGGVIFGGVVAVVGLARALCACVWRVSGCWGWTSDAMWLQCFWHVRWGMGGCGGAGSGDAVIRGQRGWLFQSGFRVHPGLILVAVVSLVQVGRWAGQVTGWLREVSCQLYFIMYFRSFVI